MWNIYDAKVWLVVEKEVLGLDFFGMTVVGRRVEYNRGAAGKLWSSRAARTRFTKVYEFSLLILH